MDGAPLRRASIAHLGTLETVAVDWNPERYSLSRRSQLTQVDALGRALSGVSGVAGGCETFATELFLDSTRDREPGRDLLGMAATLASWMEPEAPGGLPPRVAFLWGSFRFRGTISELGQEWVCFRADGTPTRGLLRLRMVR